VHFFSACSQVLYELCGVWVVGVFGEVVAEGDVVVWVGHRSLCWGTSLAVSMPPVALVLNPPGVCYFDEPL